MSDSIYVSVPSVQDQEIYNCVEQIYDLSDSPDSIYVGICHSTPFNSPPVVNKILQKINKTNVSNKFINFYRNEGVGYGRKAAMSMYNNQKYVLQIDGHTNFSQSWDDIILSMYLEIPKRLKSEKTLMTAYLPGYEIQENNARKVFSNSMPMYAPYVSERDVEQDPYLNEKSVMRFNGFESVPRWATPMHQEFYNFISGDYVLSRKINANFIFSEGYFAQDYDKIYDWEFLFLEEEFFISIQALHLGYSMVFPNMPLPLAHLYFDNFNEFYTDSSRVSVNPDEKRLKTCRRNIEKYLENPDNKERILNYCNYAGLTYPEFLSKSTYYIPGEKE
jgi:hypothetical protein